MSLNSDPKRSRKIADGGVIDAASFGEPLEIESFLQITFKPSTGPDFHHLAVEHDSGDHSWMNGGLTRLIAILRFEWTPVELSENLIDRADSMIGRYDFVE